MTRYRRFRRQSHGVKSRWLRTRSKPRCRQHSARSFEDVRMYVRTYVKDTYYYTNTINTYRINFVFQSEFSKICWACGFLPSFIKFNKNLFLSFFFPQFLNHTILYYIFKYWKKKKLTYFFLQITRMYEGKILNFQRILYFLEWNSQN